MLSKFGAPEHKAAYLQAHNSYQPRTYIYDIECYPNFFVAVFEDVETNLSYEYTDLRSLIQDIILNPQATLIGFNNKHYDDLLLRFIYRNYTEDKPITPQDIHKVSTDIIESNPPPFYLKDLKWWHDEEYGFQSIDLKSLLDPMPSLKKTEIRMRFENVQDLPLDPHKPVTEDEAKDLITYCHNDVRATRHLYKKYSIKHIELRKFLADKFNLPNPQQVQSMSEPQTAEYILKTIYCRQKGLNPYRLRNETYPTDVPLTNCIPDWIQYTTQPLRELLSELKEIELPIKMDTGYTNGSQIKKIVTINNKQYQMGIGGLHSVDAAAIFDSAYGDLVDADVTSYYPSMVLRDGLFPQTFDRDWNSIYKGIYDERLDAKIDPDRQTEAQALKIVLNATFGKFGSKYSPMYDPTLMVRITLTGQLALLMLIEQCEENDIEVLSANTDGILVWLKSPQQNAYFSQVCKEWEQHTQLNLEYTSYLRVARRDVNSYTALTKNNYTKDKGIFTPPDLKHDVQAPVIQKMARAFLLYSTAPEIYLSENINELNIFDFIFSFTATKAFSVYVRDPSPLPYTEEEKEELTALKVKKKAKQMSATESQRFEELTFKRFKPLEKLTKSNRWYTSTDDAYKEVDLAKFGGKTQNWTKLSDSKAARLVNKIESPQIPADLDLDSYIKKAKKLINSIAAV